MNILTTRQWPQQQTVCSCLNTSDYRFLQLESAGKVANVCFSIYFSTLTAITNFEKKNCGQSPQKIRFKTGLKPDLLRFKTGLKPDLLWIIRLLS